MKGLTDEQIRDIIQKLKKIKNPGKDEITAEMITIGGDELQKVISDIIKSIWRAEKMPDDWTKALTVPIYKK